MQKRTLLCLLLLIRGLGLRGQLPLNAIPASLNPTSQLALEGGLGVGNFAAFPSIRRPSSPCSRSARKI
ncbi:MAG: hypothetical protein AAGN35_06725 [Bacteroidota bacterium]